MVAAHAHQQLDDCVKRKVKEALQINPTDNFNQDSGLAVNPILIYRNLRV